MAKPAVPETPDAASLSAATAALIGADAARNAHFGIAVSGGPDSVALLLLAAAAFPGRIAAATVDHGLRAESTAEARWVADLCGTRHIPHAILRPAWPITGSLQQAARTARYALLDGWRSTAGIDWLMTAHHADDQLETIVMRLNRSSGVAGLSGIRAVQGRVLRPLLGVRHADLLGVVAAASIVPLDDPTNTDPRFDRARIRAALAGCPIDAVAASRSAATLADAEAAIAWSCAALASERITPSDGEGVTFDSAGLPDEYRRRLLVAGLRRIDPDAAPRGEAVTVAIAQLVSGKPAMLGSVAITPHAGGASWRCVAAKPRRSTGG